MRDTQGKMSNSKRLKHILQIKAKECWVGQLWGPDPVSSPESVPEPSLGQNSKCQCLE